MSISDINFSFLVVSSWSSVGEMTTLNANMENKIRIQFLFQSHSVVDYLKYCQVGSQLRLMLY